MNSTSVSQHYQFSQRQISIYSSHLDLMRGLAAITVLIGHVRFMLEDATRPATGASWVYIAPLAPGTNAMNPAHEAVVIFFVLSGALVGGSVLREQASGSFSWNQYLIKRLSRLMTVLLPALLIGFFLDSATHTMLSHVHGTQAGRLTDFSFHLGLGTFLGNLAFLQALDSTKIPSFGSNIALWSLSFEFWYYIFFPILVLSVFSSSRYKRIFYCCISLGLAIFLWRDPLLSFPVWLMGAVVASLPSFVPENWQRPLVGFSAFQFTSFSFYLWKHPLSSLLINDAILGLSFAGFVLIVLHRRAKRYRNLYDRFAENMARPSYTLYLFHYPIATLLCTWLALNRPSFIRHRSIATAVLCFVIYAACFLFYFVFEINTDRVRKYARELFGTQSHT